MVITVYFGTGSVPLWINMLAVYFHNGRLMVRLVRVTSWIHKVISLFRGGNTTGHWINGRGSGQKLGVEAVDVFGKAGLVAEPSSAVGEFALNTNWRIGTAAGAHEGGGHGF